MKQSTQYDDFTNVYSLSKTLRFELKPDPLTAEYIEKEQMLEKDKSISQSYQEIKEYFDRLHRDFINEALAKVNLDCSHYWELFQAKDKKALQIEADKLRKNFGTAFNLVGRQWSKLAGIKEENEENEGNKDQGKYRDILFKKEVLDIIKARYGQGDARLAALLETFKNFFTYFINFNESRKNFYKLDGTSTAIATRSIDVNLKIFCSNIANVQYLPDGIQLTDEERSLFEIRNYQTFLQQEKIKQYNDLIGTINGKINNYRQANHQKIGFLKILQKQILGDANNPSTKFIEITDDASVFPVLNELINNAEEPFRKFYKELLPKILPDTTDNSIDLSKVYLSKVALNTISSKVCQSWCTLKDILEKKNDFSLDNVLTSLKNNQQQAKEIFRDDVLKNFLADSNDKIFKKWLYNEYQKSYERYCAAKDVLLCKMEQDKSFRKEDQEQKNIIKEFCDAALEVYRMIKYFYIDRSQNSVEVDPIFYNILDPILDDCSVYQYYNEIRNYLTKKPFSQDKIKLNFGNGQLLQGWDENKLKDYKGAVLRHGDDYYLGILMGNKVFQTNNKEAYLDNTNGNGWELMIYKQIADAQKDVPRLFFAKANLALFQPSDNIKRIKDSKSYLRSSDNFSSQDLYDLIDYYKSCIEKYPNWQCYDFHFLPTEEYKNMKDFTDDIQSCAYKVKFVPVRDQYIKEQQSQKQSQKQSQVGLLLFKITNRDFLPQAHGRDNLHTKYFRALFDQENLQHPVIKLNGGAEIFFRQASITPKLVERGQKCIIENRRYTEDKYLFHFPITLNVNHKITPRAFRAKINNLLYTNPNINIIGIDRGENHLLYISVVNQKGEILDGPRPLDTVNGIDYLGLLEKVSKDRDRARKNWESIAKIKDLKAGYVGQVVKVIADLALQYNAIVVLEDLNTGFKRSRQKIEKQIYQNFELALINKLNYFVKKEAMPGEKGHFLSAFQLTEPITSYQDVGKQTGIIFYVPADYTSITCPQCGFHKSFNFYHKNKTEDEHLLETMDLRYDNDDECFKLTCNLMALSNNKLKLSSKNIQRWRWGTNKRELVSYDITKCLAELFSKLQINYTQERGNLLNLFISQQPTSQDYDALIFYLQLWQKIRNSSPTSPDYIQCPNCGFHSDNGFRGKEWNGDANGSYNIARKGIIILGKIKQFGDNHHDRDQEHIFDDLKWSDLSINTEEWNEYVGRQ